MKIGINHRKGSYSERWIQYCRENSIDHKVLNCYDNDIIDQLKDCDALLWHHSQNSYKDLLLAKQLLFSLEQTGKIVFPDYNTGWHFNDKLAQKYLFESLGIKSAPSHAFYKRKDALLWASTAAFPKVFKLRVGASGSHVRLVKNRNHANKLINKAFRRGFSKASLWDNFKDSIGSYRSGKDDFMNMIKGFLHLFVPTEINKKTGREKNYIMFQEFIPNEGFDYRVEITGNYCIAMVRHVRKNDFRASGGHNDHYDMELIPKDIITFAYDVYDKLKIQSCALDIVRNNDTGELFLLEISYCYSLDEDEFLHGYWDRHGNWYDRNFDSRDWMIEYVINKVKIKKST